MRHLTGSGVAEAGVSNDAVALDTTMGNITIELFADMPITTGNFENLTQLGFYDGTIFHRVIHDFVIQGGDLTSKGITVPPILDELPNKHGNVRGSVAMAKTSQPNSATSQFYINLGNNSYLDSNYVVFGQVVDGMDVVDSISNVPTDSNDRPLQDVTILEAYRVYAQNTVVSNGDIVVNGSETYVIKDCRLIQNGDIYVMDNATLILRNADLQLNQTTDWEYSIRANMSGTIETHNASISNYLASYSFGIYFSENASGTFVGTYVQKYVFSDFPSVTDIRGSISFHNCTVERAGLGWIHTAMINQSSIGSLEFNRGGFLGLTPLISIQSSTIDRLSIGDFGGILNVDAATVGDFAFGGSLFMYGNVTFRTGATISVGGQIIRNFNVIVQDDKINPIEDVELTLRDPLNNVLWHGTTNASGVSDFNVTFTIGNYNSYLSTLEAAKGNWTGTKSIRFTAATPLLFAAPDFSDYRVHNVNTRLNYTTVQEAISANETLNGHVISVDAGSFNEDITVDKTLTLSGYNRSSVVNGTICVQANGVEIRGFSVQNSQGIQLENALQIAINENIVGNSSGFGITLNNVSNSQISFNEICSNYYDGICLDHNSNNNTISSNRIRNFDRDGIGIHQSSLNRIESNTIINGGTGLHIRYSINNVAKANTIDDCTTEIWMEHSHNNTLYHNNFLNTTTESSLPDSTDNTWDNGLEGNYWQQYNGTDTANPDGIGDSPYLLAINNTDNYPLKGPFSSFNATTSSQIETVCNSTISDFHFNGTTITFNVTGDNGTTGFCRILMPTTLMNGTYIIYVNNTEVSYSLLQCSNDTYSFLYFTYKHSTQEVIVISEFQSIPILLFFQGTILTLVAFFHRHYLRVRSEHDWKESHCSRKPSQD